MKTVLAKPPANVSTVMPFRYESPKPISTTANAAS
jgi:hypothetical protein